MYRIRLALLVLMLASSVLVAEDKSKDKAATPGEQYKALLKEHQNATEVFSKAYTEALNDAGIYAGIYLFSGEFLLRFRCHTDGYDDSPAPPSAPVPELLPQPHP